MRYYANKSELVNWIRAAVGAYGKPHWHLKAELFWEMVAVQRQNKTTAVFVFFSEEFQECYEIEARSLPSMGNVSFRNDEIRTVFFTKCDEFGNTY